MSQRLFHKSFQNTSTVYCGQGGTFCNNSDAYEKKQKKLKDIKTYLLQVQQKYKEYGVIINCPESIKFEIMAIRKNYRIERDNVANMMKYIENRLNNAHLIRNKRHRRRISPSNMRKKAKK